MLMMPSRPPLGGWGRSWSFKSGLSYPRANYQYPSLAVGTYGSVPVWVATGVSGSAAGADYSTSVDGSNWVTHTDSPRPVSGDLLVYLNGQFINVGNSYPSGNTNTIITSPSGTEWYYTIGNMTNTNGPAWVAGAFGNSKYVFLGRYPSGVVTASQPTTGGGWGYSYLGTTGSRAGALAFGAGVFVLVSANPFLLCTSPDGVTWTTRSVPLIVDVLFLGFVGGKFVLIGPDSTGSTIYVTSSSDGITWSAATPTVTTEGASMPTATPFGSATNGNVIVQNILSTNLLSIDTYVSGDGGLSWSKGATILPVNAGYEFYTGTSPVVSPDGQTLGMILIETPGTTGNYYVDTFSSQ